MATGLYSAECEGDYLKEAGKDAHAKSHQGADNRKSKWAGLKERKDARIDAGFLSWTRLGEALPQRTYWMLCTWNKRERRSEPGLIRSEGSAGSRLVFVVVTDDAADGTTWDTVMAQEQTTRCKANKNPDELAMYS